MTLKRKLLLAFATAFIAVLAIAVTPGAPIDMNQYPASGFHHDPRLEHPQSLPPVAFSIIKTGGTRSVAALLYDGGSWFEPRMSTHSAVLVKHPRAAFLFDTGLGTHVDAQFAGMPFWLRPLMAYEMDRTAHDQLAVHRQDIQEVFISHLHWDHASGIKDFPTANVWTTRGERDAANRENPGLGYIRVQYDGDKINWRDLEFADAPYENFSQSVDYFGDGSVVFVPLPGHTPGSIGMFVNLRSGQRYFFTSDTTWTLEGFQRPANKFWLPRAIVDGDMLKTRDSIVKVNQLMQHYPNLIVVPAHDLRVQERIGFFPKLEQ